MNKPESLKTAIAALIVLPFLAAAAEPTRMVMPDDLKVAFENARYAITPDKDGGRRAVNAANRFSVKFSGADTIIDAGHGVPAKLHVAEYGWGTQLRPPGEVTQVQSLGKRLDRQYGKVFNEWFENTPRGLEQAFVIAQRDQGVSGPLHIRLAAGSDWQVKGAGAGVRLTHGAIILDYAGLKAWDAKGKTIASRLRAIAQGDIEIEVDDAHVVYPLTIDPTYTQQQELTSSDSASNGYGAGFGESVALSADGNTALIGTPYRGQGSEDGGAYVFTRSAATWSQQQILVGTNTDGSQFGFSVALSGDGNTAMVGAQFAQGQGRAYVFTRSGATWTQRQILVGSDSDVGQENDNFGAAVALSGDGNTALVGDPNHLSNQGAVYVFVGGGASWTQQQKLTAFDAKTGGDFGYCTALSSDGNTAIIGAIEQNIGGAAYVFTRASAIWTLQMELTASDENPGWQFGGSVALSGDGNTALAGALGSGISSTDNRLGSAYVFTRMGTAWTQQTELRASDGENGDAFGAAVALSSDGNTALVGAQGRNGRQGAVYVFTPSETTWTQQQILTASDGAAGDAFGGLQNAIALSSDGSTAIAGSYPHNSTTGAAYVFTLPPLASVVLSATAGSTGTFVQGQTGVFTVEVTNNASNASTVTSGTTTVVDTLPSGYTLTSYSGGDWSCSGTTAVTCTTSDQVAGGGGQFAVLSLTVNIPANAAASATNNVAAYGGGDPAHDSLATAVTASAMVTVTTALPTTPVTYTFSGTTQNVMVVAGHGTLPAGTPFNGTFTFDPTQVGTMAPLCGGIHGSYNFSKMSLTVAGSTVTFGPGSIDVNYHLTVTTCGYPAGDSFYVNLTSMVPPGGLIDGLPFNVVLLGLVDNTGTAFTSAVPPTNLNFGSFQAQFIEFNYVNGICATCTTSTIQPLSTLVLTELQPQTITWASIGTQKVGVPLTLTATASSMLPVAYSAATTPAVCAVSGNMATFLTAGECSITASQAGNSVYAPAPAVTRSFLATTTGLPAPVTAVTSGGGAVQCSGGNSSCSTPLTITNSGDTEVVSIVFCANGACTSTPGCTVTASDGVNAYAAVPDAQVSNVSPNGSEYLYMAVFDAPNVVSGTYTLTFEVTGTGCSMNCAGYLSAEFSGASVSAPIDGAVSNTGWGTGTNFSLASAGNVSNSGELAYALIASSGSALSISSPYLLLDQIFSNGIGAATNAPASGSRTTVSGKIASPSPWWGSLIALTPTSSSGPQPPPPLISSVTATNITSSSVTITWTTDEPSTSQAEYGTTTSYTGLSSLNSSLVTSHSITITGLSPSTTYDYAAMSVNSSGEQTTSQNFTFTTEVSTAAPVTKVTSNGGDLQCSGGNTTCSAPLTITKSGNTEVVSIVFCANGGCTSTPGCVVTASDGINSYTAVPSAQIANVSPNGSEYLYMAVFSAPNVVSGAYTLLFHTTGTGCSMNYAGYLSAEFSGANAVTPIDPAVSNTGSGSGASFLLDSTASVSSSGELAYALVATSGPALSISSPYMLLNQIFSNGFDAATDAPASGLPTAVSGKIASSSPWWGSLIALTPSSSSGPPAPPQPVISSVTATNISSSSATLAWTTDEPSTSQVEYGTTTNYGSLSSLNSSLVTSHSITLTGLNPSTMYDYAAMSSNSIEEQTISSNYTFTTTGSSASTIAAVVSSGGGLPCSGGNTSCTTPLTIMNSGDTEVASIVFCANGGCTSTPGCTVTASDSANTYTAVPNAQVGNIAPNGTEYLYVAVFSAPSVVSGAHTLTFHITGTGCSMNYSGYLSAEFSGANAATPIDAAVSHNGSGTGTSFSLASMSNVSNSNELAYALVASSGPALTMNGPYLLLNQTFANGFDAATNAVMAGSPTTVSGKIAAPALWWGSLIALTP